MTAAGLSWPTPGHDLEAARADFPARLVVDPSAIAANYRSVCGLAEGAQVMPIIKANAYGHGLLVAARALADAGAGWLGVAQLEEALRLAAWARDESLKLRVFSWIYAPGQVAAAVRAGVHLGVSSPAQVLDAVVGARQGDAPALLHLAVDTGMGRAGATAVGLPALIAAVHQAGESGAARLVGLWSHLARADSGQLADRAATARQLAEFEVAEERLRSAGLVPKVRHLAASAGLLWHRATRKDLVRPGIVLYGLSPNPAAGDFPQPQLRPAMRFEALLAAVKRVDAGAAVSYGGTWSAATPRWLGIVPVGYSNGVPRQASNRAEVAVNGQRYRQVGRICMDQFMIDLGPAADHTGADIPAPARVGDLVTLFGAPGAPSAWDWAGWAGTIAYEICCQAGINVPRRLAGPALG